MEDDGIMGLLAVIRSIAKEVADKAIREERSRIANIIRNSSAVYAPSYEPGPSVIDWDDSMAALAEEIDKD